MAELSADKPVQVALELVTVPPLVCRPRQITAAFGAMLQQVCEVSQPGAQLRVATQMSGPHIEAAVKDEGEGPAETRERCRIRAKTMKANASGEVNSQAQPLYQPRADRRAR